MIRANYEFMTMELTAIVDSLSDNSVSLKVPIELTSKTAPKSDLLFWITDSVVVIVPLLTRMVASVVL